MSNFFDTQTLKEDFNIEMFLDSEITEAEFLVLQRYIPVSDNVNPALGVFPQLSVSTFRPRLKGFVGTIKDPQIESMDDLLVYAIRQTIVNLLEYNEDNENVLALTQGNQSISYRNVEPSTTSIYKPLRIFDNRDDFMLL